MLVGRRVESERIERLLEDARSGIGSALILSGPAGVGKTALLDLAASRGQGMTVLRAAGVAWEAELAFSGALELLKPILDRASELPDPQRQALGGALALVPAVEVDRFAVCAATLRLLTMAAAQSPLLLLVDDAQWLDSASLEALVFAARRVAGEAIGVAFAVREEHSSMLDSSGLPRLAVQPLGAEDSIQLARRLVDTTFSAAQEERIHQLTEGYPLALVELGRLDDPAPDPEAPLPVSRAVERAYARDVERCEAGVQDLLLLAAAEDTGELAVILDAAERLGVDAGALDAAEAGRMITIDAGRLTFRHPLIRSAVYQTAEGARRRAAHEALSQSLAGDGHADRHAWHRAAAARGPDEQVAEELEATAQRTRARSGYAAAASALEKAAHLTPDAGRRARRLVTAADALWHAGRGERAEALLASSLSRTSDPLLHVEIQTRRGRLAHFRGETELARTLIIDASARAADHDPHLALTTASAAVLPALCSGNLPGLRTTLADVARLCDAAPEVRDPEVAMGVGAALAAQGRLAAARPYLELTVEAAGRPDDADPQLLAYAADCLGWLGRYPEARAASRRALEHARESGALAALAWAALHLTDYEIALGDTVAAVATAGEARQIAGETGQLLLRGWSSLYLALIAANQGAAERTRAYLAEVEELGVPLWFNGIDAVPWIRGRLALSAGDAAAALPHLELAVGQVAPHANWVPWTASADLVEAWVRTGHTREARDAVTALAPAVEQEWAAAGVERCRGLTSGDDFDDGFTASIARFERLSVPFEAARSRLCFGERLRRAGRRVEARTQLRAACAAFDRLRAEAWAARAQRELELTGEVVARSNGAEAIDELTPQELHVALTVASGLTNKQAAARLFLSTKTIEAHLHRTFRKLGIHSRDELAPLLAAHGPRDDPPRVEM